MSQTASYNAVITVVGHDRVGIIAEITRILADANINILDISQTILQDVFTMIMLVDTENMALTNDALRQQLAKLGASLNLNIQLQHKDIFNAMQRI
ncbi:MAG TPA: ACT domain-containing protein [Clostridiaceae bacterium]|nr:ACT domain-containing protein [Clostridiaceae bacterium]